jgi:hypothetical protein
VEKKHEEGRRLVHHLRTKISCILLHRTARDNINDRQKQQLKCVEKHSEKKNPGAIKREVNCTDRATAVASEANASQRSRMAVNLGFIDPSFYIFIQLVCQLSSGGSMDYFSEDLVALGIQPGTLDL